jgi:hypothetical protein
MLAPHRPENQAPRAECGAAQVPLPVSNAVTNAAICRSLERGVLIFLGLGFVFASRQALLGREAHRKQCSLADLRGSRERLASEEWERSDQGGYVAFAAEGCSGTPPGASPIANRERRIWIGERTCSGFVDPASSDHRALHANREELEWVRFKRVTLEHDEVGELAGRDRALDTLLE